MESKKELQRNAEARREERASYQHALDTEWENSWKVGRTGRNSALMEAEADMQKAFQERTDHAAKDNDLSDPITKNLDEINKQMHSHNLREHDHSLRDMQRTFEDGNVRNDLKQQMLHNEYQRLQDKVEESHANKVILDALYDAAEAAGSEDRSNMERDMEYCKEMEQQLVTADEDQRELQHKSDMQEIMRKEMVASQLDRSNRRQKDKDRDVIEDRNVERQCQTATDWGSATIEERERKMRVREEQTILVGSHMIANAAAKRHREDEIQCHQAQEVLDQNAADDEASWAKTERYKVEAMADRADHARWSGQIAADLKESDAQFHRESVELMAMEDEKERKKELLRKEKNHQYSLDLRKQIEDNASRKKAEKEAEQLLDRQRYEADTQWYAKEFHRSEKVVEGRLPHHKETARVVKHED